MTVEGLMNLTQTRSPVRTPAERSNEAKVMRQFNEVWSSYKTDDFSEEWHKERPKSRDFLSRDYKESRKSLTSSMQPHTPTRQNTPGRSGQGRSRAATITGSQHQAKCENDNAAHVDSPSTPGTGRRGRSHTLTASDNVQLLNDRVSTAPTGPRTRSDSLNAKLQLPQVTRLAQTAMGSARGNSSRGSQQHSGRSGGTGSGRLSAHEGQHFGGLQRQMSTMGGTTRTRATTSDGSKTAAAVLTVPDDPEGFGCTLAEFRHKPPQWDWDYMDLMQVARVDPDFPSQILGVDFNRFCQKRNRIRAHSPIRSAAEMIDREVDRGRRPRQWDEARDSERARVMNTMQKCDIAPSGLMTPGTKSRNHDPTIAKYVGEIPTAREGGTPAGHGAYEHDWSHHTHHRSVSASMASNVTRGKARQQDDHAVALASQSPADHGVIGTAGAGAGPHHSDAAADFNFAMGGANIVPSPRLFKPPRKIEEIRREKNVDMREERKLNQQPIWGVKPVYILPRFITPPHHFDEGRRLEMGAEKFRTALSTGDRPRKLFAILYKCVTDTTDKFVGQQNPMIVAFRLFCDRRVYISKHAWAKGFGTLGLSKKGPNGRPAQFNDLDIKFFFEVFDVDKDGEIGFKEFGAQWTRLSDGLKASRGQIGLQGQKSFTLSLQQAQEASVADAGHGGYGGYGTGSSFSDALDSQRDKICVDPMASRRAGRQERRESQQIMNEGKDAYVTVNGSVTPGPLAVDDASDEEFAQFDSPGLHPMAPGRRQQTVTLTSTNSTQDAAEMSTENAVHVAGGPLPIGFNLTEPQAVVNANQDQGSLQLQQNSNETAKAFGASANIDGGRVVDDADDIDDAVRRRQRQLADDYDDIPIDASSDEHDATPRFGMVRPAEQAAAVKSESAQQSNITSNDSSFPFPGRAGVGVGGGTLSSESQPQTPQVDDPASTPELPGAVTDGGSSNGSVHVGWNVPISSSADSHNHPNSVMQVSAENLP